MAATDPDATAGHPRSRAVRPRMRFPCGHIEGEASVARRVHERPRALIVSCRQCNLVLLVVAPGHPAPRGRGRQRPTRRSGARA
jgi:hypothetical protein